MYGYWIRGVLHPSLCQQPNISWPHMVPYTFGVQHEPSKQPVESKMIINIPKKYPPTSELLFILKLAGVLVSMHNNTSGFYKTIMEK